MFAQLAHITSITLLALLFSSSAWAQAPATTQTAGRPTDSAKVEAPAPLIIANAFTPNGDGFNDRFIPSPELQRYKLVVYDRWGNLVHSGNHTQHWEGQNIQGAPLPDGVYVFRLEGLTVRGDTLRHTGTVTLLR